MRPRTLAACRSRVRFNSRTRVCPARVNATTTTRPSAPSRARARSPSSTRPATARLIEPLSSPSRRTSAVIARGLRRPSFRENVTLRHRGPATRDLLTLGPHVEARHLAKHGASDLQGVTIVVSRNHVAPDITASGTCQVANSNQLWRAANGGGGARRARAGLRGRAAVHDVSRERLHHRRLAGHGVGVRLPRPGDGVRSAATAIRPDDPGRARSDARRPLVRVDIGRCVAIRLVENEPLRRSDSGWLLCRSRRRPRAAAFRRSSLPVERAGNEAARREPVAPSSP